MNKQELIEELQKRQYQVVFGDDDNIYMTRRAVLELVEKLNETKKPVVPQFVADWLEKEQGRVVATLFTEAIENAPDEVINYVYPQGSISDVENENKVYELGLTATRLSMRSATKSNLSKLVNISQRMLPQQMNILLLKQLTLTLLTVSLAKSLKTLALDGCLTA